MTLMDYCMQYIDEIMDGKRPAPEGITLTETDPVARGMELLPMGMEPSSVPFSMERIFSQ